MNRFDRNSHKSSAPWRLLARPPALAILLALTLNACASSAPAIHPMRPPAVGFCDLGDTELEKYVVGVNVSGRSNGSGVATIVDGRLYILTNRHNLPEDFTSWPAEIRNHDYALTSATAIVAGGRDYAKSFGLHYADDFAVLEVQDPSLFHPLPLHEGRHQGPVVVPSFPDRHYAVGRGRQWFEDDKFDMLDFSLNIGASGAPVVDCEGYVTGLYTALIEEKDWQRAGFKGLSTPIARVRKALGK